MAPSLILTLIPILLFPRDTVTSIAGWSFLSTFWLSSTVALQAFFSTSAMIYSKCTVQARRQNVYPSYVFQEKIHNALHADVEQKSALVRIKFPGWVRVSIMPIKIGSNLSYKAMCCSAIRRIRSSKNLLIAYTPGNLIHKSKNNNMI